MLMQISLAQKEHVLEHMCGHVWIDQRALPVVPNNLYQTRDDACQKYYDINMKVNCLD
jgi:hypothetical protein